MYLHDTRRKDYIFIKGIFLNKKQHNIRKDQTVQHLKSSLSFDVFMLDSLKIFINQLKTQLEELLLY